jgi:hypothetical protein
LYWPATGDIFIPMYDYGPVVVGTNNALVFTRDLKTFAVLCRFPGNYAGVHQIIGVDAANRYLYLEVRNSRGGSVNYRCAMPRAAQVNAVRVKSATTNILNTPGDNSMSDGTVGHWTTYAGGALSTVPASSVPSSIRQSGTLGKFTTDTSSGGGRIISGSYSTFGQRAPAAGTFVLAAALLWSDDADYDQCCVSFGIRYSSNNCASVWQNQHSIGRKPSWVVWLGQYLATDTGSNKLMIQFGEPNYIPPVARRFYIDRIIWRTGADPAMLYQTFQNEVASTADSFV